MLIKNLENTQQIVASDLSILQQLLHPDNDKLNISYSLAHAKLLPHSKSLPHKLEATEVYYILQGKGIMYIEEQHRNVQKGDAIFIPANAVQHIENPFNEELIFLCIVNPQWQKEQEIILA